MTSRAPVKVGMVAVLGALLLFAATDAIAAHDAHGSSPDATVRVLIQRCALDPHSHIVHTSGTVDNGTKAAVSSYGFSVAFTDAGGDEEDEPVTVGTVPAGGRVPFAVQSKSPFPSTGVHCALADLNAPGDL